MTSFPRMASVLAIACLASVPQVHAQQPGLATGGIAGGFPANGGEIVKGAPYSAEAITETSQARADGNAITHKTSTRIYRDSDGRERREESLDPVTGRGSNPQPVILISDPVEGANYMLNVLRHSAVRMPIAPAAVRPYNPPSGNSSLGPSIQITPMAGPGGAGAQLPQIIIQQGNHTEVTGPGGLAGPVGTASAGPASNKIERLEPKMIEGLRAEGTRTTETIPANRVGNGAPFDIVTETWMSPELKIPLMTKRSDPRTGEAVYSLTNISRAEPDHALFEVPDDYTIQAFPSISGGILPDGGSIGVSPRR